MRKKIPTPAPEQITAMLDKMVEHFGAGMLTSILYNQLPRQDKNAFKEAREAVFRKHSFTHPEADLYSYLSKHAKEVLENRAIRDWLIAHHGSVYRAVQKTLSLSAFSPYRSAEEYQSYCKTLDPIKQRLPKATYAEIEKAVALKDQMGIWKNQGLRGLLFVRSKELQPFLKEKRSSRKWTVSHYPEIRLPYGAPRATK